MASRDIEVILTVKLERSERMTMHDERWTIGVAENGDIKLRDQKTGEAQWFGGPRALFDALGVLANWREQNRDYDVPPRPTEAEYASLPVLDLKQLMEAVDQDDMNTRPEGADQ